MSATDSTVENTTSNPVEKKPDNAGEEHSVDAGQKKPVNPGEGPSTTWHQQACAEAVHDQTAALITKTSEEGLHAGKAVVVRSDRLWDNGSTLTFGFMGNEPLTPFQANQQAKVRTVVKEWQKYTNIIFSYVEDAATANIRITFNPDSGSWSFVGKEVLTIKADKPTMNLGWIDGSTDVISANENGVILHEFGHTLGLMHEHQSPLRGNKLTLKKSAIIEFYTSTQGWSEQDVQQQILDVYNARDVSNYSEVDLTSIMQYFMPPELNEQNIRVDPNNKLSEVDKAFMIINYPPFVPSFVDVKAGKSDPSLRAKFEGALDIVGVDGRIKVLILQHYDAQKWAEIRYEFTLFCTTRRIARKFASVEGPPSFGGDPEAIVPDGCLSDGDAGATDASRGVATVDADLWLPGTRITYSWVQGGLDATEHRKKVVRDTFASYASHMNLKFEEVPFDPKTLNAKMHFYFGPIPVPGVTGWSKIGKKSEGYRQTLEQLKTRGGTVESSIVLSDLAVPKVASTDDTAIKREQRTLFHEIGHALGLKHEHASPNTVTTDTIDPNFSAATIFDDTSVMLYANRKFRQGASFPALKDYFDPTSTKFNHAPSKLDLAFLGALYPNRSGHVDDHFASDIKELGLSGSATSLTALRDAAFAVEGHPEFANHIQKYRQALQAKLMALVPARTIIPPAHAPVPPSSPGAARGVAPPAKATTGSFVDELVKSLQTLFKPTTGQMFALQFPGRFLQQDLYAWDTSSAGIYGQFVKPTVVNESEFRLVDQLYNVGSVVGAPSGINLSIVYEQCLNNLVPGVPESSVHFMKQQSQIRNWLLKDVPTSGWVTDLIQSQHSQSTGFNQGGFRPVGSADPGFSAKSPSRAIGAPGEIKPDAKPSDAPRAIAASSAINPDAKPQFAIADKLSQNGKVNRMELADALMQEYLSAKQAWELERDEMIRNANGKDMDALTRRLAHITAIRQSQLAAKHADAVVRGYSHAVRQYLGFLDVKTPAEILQDAKDALRESAMSSLDGSMKVYPVQMSPIDWFQSLSTSFTMEDLTVNADIIAQQLQSKSKQLDMLNTRLSVIQSKPKIDLKELQSKLDAAQTACDKVQWELTTTYTSNIISLAKTFIDLNNKFQFASFKAQALSSSGITEAAFKNIEVGMDKLTTAQLNVAQNSRALTLLQSQKALAEATDTTQEVIETQVQIKALTKDVDELTTRLQSLRYGPKAPPAAADPSKPTSVQDIALFPPPSSSGGSRWQDIVMKHKIDNLYSASSDQSQAANSKSNLSLFFGSYQSEKSSSSASSDSASSTQSVEVEVGFRATMVTVDRGGWFQPQFFKQSAGFHCIDPNVSWSKWPENVKTMHDLTPDNVAAFTELNKHLLPAYPVGFLVCKDITIRIHMDSTDMKNSSSVMEKYAANSGGVLCWSTSSSEHEKSSDKSHSFESKSNGAVIRIPGPQILGYILQFTDSDKTKVISEKLPTGFLLSDEDYNSSFADKPATPGRAADPTAPPNGPPPKAADPAKPEPGPVPAPKN